MICRIGMRKWQMRCYCFQINIHFFKNHVAGAYAEPETDTEFWRGPEWLIKHEVNAQTSGQSFLMAADAVGHTCPMVR